MSSIRMTLDEDLIKKLFDDLDPEVKIEFQNKIVYAMMERALLAISENRIHDIAESVYKDVEAQYITRYRDYFNQDFVLSKDLRTEIVKRMQNFVDMELPTFFDPEEVCKKFVGDIEENVRKTMVKAYEKEDREFVRGIFHEEMSKIFANGPQA